MKFVINRQDFNNIKITAIINILAGESIGIWVTDKPMSKKSRYLFQEHMLKDWWETDDLGRYCNHSLTPNTRVIFHENRLELIANKHINSGDEILVDYRKITQYVGYNPTISF